MIGKLQSSKWAKICKCSQDTAIRDIKDLMGKGILQQEKQGGRSTNWYKCKKILFLPVKTVNEINILQVHPSR